ncbi:MlaA family lipoprotein [Pollutimonas harenae]|uniref:VacJ family lipoprotein n=1 Tax=Pollutimonas harenae TaxID=657015 RepID=A0A853GX77_9BURK|nr:VacJ family lipoprotein [Pollutimonas harenae]NYT84380.1 VacJ family lipoprotein [Pollutimonas harenae]TEA73219.1 VacJ family lipoprotein [Pollutimonas harenae]
MTTFSASSSGHRFLRLGGLLGATALAAGCASVPNPSPNDPWESYNRSMYAFNDTVDRAFLKPIATGYDTLMPDPAQNCVHNIFNNLGDAWSAINSFLQGRGHDFFNTLGRVLFNSTMGLGGCIDVASMNGSQRIRNDFGTTLGVWGFDSGPYVVLPFLGSSTVRDGTAFVGTLAAGVSPITPVFHIENVPVRNSLVGLYIVDTRAGLLDADELVNDIALDRYSFIRDAYLQQREAMVKTRRHGQSAPDYSEDALPDYSDDSLPDYTDPEDTNDAASTPAAGTTQ